MTLGLCVCASLLGCGDDSGPGQIGTGLPGDPCMGTVDCVPGSICWNEICLQEGMLRVSLAWTADSDFDLHVLTPGGNEIYFANTEADGGMLDVDDCITLCTSPDSTHVENIFFDTSVPPGTYQVWAVNYDGRAGGDYSLEVSGAATAAFDGSLPATAGAEDTRHPFSPE